MAVLVSYLKEKEDIVNAELDRHLQRTTSTSDHPGIPQSILEAMRYAVFAGGKRIRPILAIAAFEALAGANRGTQTLNQEHILPAACSLEMIHTYSLIHDDLPSMDNDDFRRGKPATHKAFGEAIAILAGDALLTLAFEVLSKYPDDEALNEKKLRIIRTVSHACGTDGLIGGQVLDLQSEGKRVGLSEFENLHLMKTGALIEASLLSGAIIADANIQDEERIRKFGRTIGLAYQIVDDLLDAQGDREIVGKETGKDHKKKKATFPSFHGIEESRKIAQNLMIEAKESIKPLGERSVILSLLADFIVTRRR